MSELPARDDDEISGTAVGIGVLVASVVALTSRALQRGENVPFILSTFRPAVEGGICCMNVVFRLLSHERIVGLTLQLVTASAIFMGGVIFQSEF